MFVCVHVYVHCKKPLPQNHFTQILPCLGLTHTHMQLHIYNIPDTKKGEWHLPRNGRKQVQKHEKEKWKKVS